jgi:hypothetical protein
MIGISRGAESNEEEQRDVSIHLTPTELADEMKMKRRDVLFKCQEMGVPIFNGRIDKTLFASSLRRFTEQTQRARTA